MKDRYIIILTCMFPMSAVIGPIGIIPNVVIYILIAWLVLM